jgi:hypothetical protein
MAAVTCSGNFSVPSIRRAESSGLFVDGRFSLRNEGDAGKNTYLYG